MVGRHERYGAKKTSKMKKDKRISDVLLD